MSARHDPALRIQWGYEKRTTTMRPDGVLALAAKWVREETARSGIAPGVKDVHYALISLCDQAGFVYPNSRSAYQTLIRWTAALRRVGRFPALSDDSRFLDLDLCFDGADDALQWTAARFRLDRTEGQENQLWVAVEKRGLRARTRQWLDEYGLPIIAMGGFSSEVIERKTRRAIEQDGRPAILLVFSDFDPSGLLLPETFVANVARFEHVDRVALTAKQIDLLGLPEDPAPAKDSRLDWFIKKTGRDVQVEINALLALHPGELERLLLDAVGRYWDADVAKEVLARELPEIALLQRAQEFVRTNREEAT